MSAEPAPPLADVGVHEAFDVDPPYVPDDEALAAVEKYSDRFLDRELSWLHFNERVLELAEDTSLPLLERVRFTAIFATNLDEFFMVRVAGQKRRIAAGVAVRAASGLLPREVLEKIWSETGKIRMATDAASSHDSSRLYQKVIFLNTKKRRRWAPPSPPV